MIFYNDSISGTPNNNWLVSFSESVQFLNKNSSIDDSLSGFLTLNIQLISDKFEQYIRHGIKQQTYIGYYDGSGSRKLFVENFPINSIISVEYRNSPTDSWSSYYTGSATSNILCYSNHIKLYDTYFQCGSKNIKIVYQAGYESTPADIKQCALEAIQENYNHSLYGNNTLGMKSKSLTNVGSTYTYEDIWEKHKQILDNYRHISI